MKIRFVAGSLALVALLGLAACSDDGDDDAAPTQDEVVTETDDELVNQAIDDYRTYVIEQVDQIVAEARVFTDAVRSGDVAAAQEAYAPSRQSWERIEPVAGLVEEIDGAVDARVDDFEDEQDPEFTGWHRLEYLVFDQETTEGATELADQLDADLATLQEEIQTVEFQPAVVALGAAELIQEVTGGKITGEEDRYSGTDLWDFAANVEGAEAVIDFLTPALEEADPELLSDIQDGFAQVDAGLAPYQDGEGYLPYSELTQEDKDELQAQLAGLSESLAQVPGALGLTQ